MLKRENLSILFNNNIISYLNDLRIGMFLEGKFHRVDDSIYKSISKDHLY